MTADMIDMPVAESFFAPGARSLSRILVTFTISLVAFHTVAFLLKNGLDQNILRIINYVYLGVATLGLFAAADIDKEFNKQRNLSYQSFFSTLTPDIKSVVSKYKDRVCLDNSEVSCTSYTEAVRNPDMIIATIEKMPANGYKGSNNLKEHSSRALLSLSPQDGGYNQLQMLHEAISKFHIIPIPERSSD